MPSLAHIYDTIVIGAGMAGAICATHLVEAGLDVLVLDKSRGVGGRMATRRVQVESAESSKTDTIADHGVQYITVKGDRFRRFVKQQLELGTMAEWTRSIHRLDVSCSHPTELEEAPLDERVPHYCCPQGMTAVVKQLCKNLNVERRVRAIAVQPMGDRWRAIAEDGGQFEGKSLVIAVPAPQILEMLGDWLTEEYPLYSSLTAVRYNPCIAVIAGYRKSVTPPQWKGVKWVGDDRVAWVSLDSTKRVLAANPVVVVHSTPGFANQSMNADVVELQECGLALLQRTGQRLGEWLVAPDWMQVHRWKYSLPAETVGLTSLGMSVPVQGGEGYLPLVCAGDWCAGGRVEGAFISGVDAAQRVKGDVKALAAGREIPRLSNI